MLRTDLAVESASDINDSEGVLREEFSSSGMEICKIAITSASAAKRLGKPEGNYVTLSKKRLFDYSEDFSDKARLIAEQIRSFLPEQGPVLVAGLGNRAITPDALGPLVADSVLSTRHFSKDAAHAFGLDKLRSVSVIATGVLGQTGIETAELISSVAEKVSPCAVIAVDALAARDLSRLTSTVQLCDTGISPGAGVQNRRSAITESLLGVPVIAIGVPTVVDLNNFCESDCEPDGYAMMITARDIDTVIGRAASLISMAINMALHPELSGDDILFLNS